MRSAADESPDIELYIIVSDFLFFLPHFKPERLEGEWGRKTGQNFALFDLL